MKPDALVIGGGPAGIAAAVQLTRMGFKVLAVEKNQVGGLMRNARWIENYPGFPNGVSGKALSALFRRQLRRWKVRVVRAAALGIGRKGNRFTVKTKRRAFSAPCLVLACGSKGLPLGVRGETELMGKKVFYEAEALSSLKRGQTVCVIGSGDIAFDYALSLARRKTRCTLLLRGRKPRCIPLLWKAARKAGVKVWRNVRVTALTSAGGKLHLECRVNEKRRALEADYALVAVGREPDLGVLPKAWRKRLRKNPRALEKQGLFLAGDMKPGNSRHIGIAVGDGLRAAMAIGRRLSCR